jgi:4-amino-4-deoxy-L-arabinose transferase-like glycosyltransferase
VAGSRLTERAVHGSRGPLVAICVFVVALGLWNAAHYPTGAGYDAPDHLCYANGIFPGFDLPHRDSLTCSGEYYTPPGFYLAAGVVDWLAKQTGYGDPDRAGQVLNMLFWLGTVLLVAAIARALWPGRRRIELGAAAFVAFLPVVVETSAMFHPEPMSLFLSTLALWLCVRTFSNPRYAWALGVTLGAAQLVRAFALWTVAAVAIGLFVGRRFRSLAIVLVLAALIPAPWYIHQRLTYGGQPEFPQPASHHTLGASFFVNPGLPGVFTKPFRPHHHTLAIATTYDSIWGDYWGIWAWHACSPCKTGVPVVTKPSSSARHLLQLQSLLGLVPTLLALVGWVLFARESTHRREALAVTLLAPLALIGYLYFAVVYWPKDGDLLKATYMLTATSAWAIGFGYALDRLRGRLWQVTCALLVVFALLELPFLVY